MARAIGGLLGDPDLAAGGWGGRPASRAEASFDYDQLAPRLAASLADVEG